MRHKSIPDERISAARKLPTAILLALLCAPVMLFAPSASAQNDGPKLERATYDKLSAARKLSENKQYGAAIKDLRSLLGKTDEPQYDRAIVLQTLGYAYLDQGDQTSAINAFAKALALDAMPAEPTRQVQYALGQLYAANEQYAQARDVLQQWLAQPGVKPSAQDYVLLANVYAQLEDYGDGISAIRKAIRLQSTPSREYYQLLTAMLFQSERYSEGANVLVDMLQIWPDEKQYWNQLADIYLSQKKEDKAHSTLVLAYRKGLLRTQSELLRLAQLGMAVKLPEHAARVIEKGMQDSRIVSTEEHWRLLASAWSQAKETDKAIAAYDKAAEFGSAGEYRLRQAELHLRDNDWRKVLVSADQALAAGDLKQPGRAHLLRGMAYIQLKEYPQSLDALQHARRYSDTVGQATRWAEYVQRRQKTES